MKMCCQYMGKSRAAAPWTHAVNCGERKQPKERRQRTLWGRICQRQPRRMEISTFFTSFKRIDSNTLEKSKYAEINILCCNLLNWAHSLPEPAEPQLLSLSNDPVNRLFLKSRSLISVMRLCADVPMYCMFDFIALAFNLTPWQKPSERTWYTDMSSAVVMKTWSASDCWRKRGTGWKPGDQPLVFNSWQKHSRGGKDWWGGEKKSMERTDVKNCSTALYARGAWNQCFPFVVGHHCGVIIIKAHGIQLKRKKQNMAGCS